MKDQNCSYKIFRTNFIKKLGHVLIITTNTYTAAIREKFYAQCFLLTPQANECYFRNVNVNFVFTQNDLQFIHSWAGLSTAKRAFREYIQSLQVTTRLTSVRPHRLFRSQRHSRCLLAPGWGFRRFELASFYRNAKSNSYPSFAYVPWPHRASCLLRLF